MSIRYQHVRVRGIICAVVVILAILWLSAPRPPLHAHPLAQTSAPMSEFSFVAPPSISVETYQAIYCQQRHGRVSDACPHAPQMYQLLVDAGIDPVIELAFAAKETEFGVTGPGRAPQHNIHNIVCNRWDGGTCEGPYHARFATYPDYPHAIRSWITLILHRGIYVDAGNDTFRKVLPIYAPPFENNTAQYIAQVEGWVRRWRSRGGSTYQPVDPSPPWWMSYEGVISPTWGRGHGYDGYDDMPPSEPDQEAATQPGPSAGGETDLLSILPGSPAFPEGTLAIDNSSSGFSASQETWSLEGCGTNDEHIATLSTSTQSRSTSRASWRAPLRRAGRYEVRAYIPTCGTPLPTRSAHYTISHDEGVSEAVVDQEAHAGEWVSLGVYPFGARYTPLVDVSDLAADDNRGVRVDAMVWIPQPDTDQQDTATPAHSYATNATGTSDPLAWFLRLTYCPETMVSFRPSLTVPRVLCRWEWWFSRSMPLFDALATWQQQVGEASVSSAASGYSRVPLPPPPAAPPTATSTPTRTPLPASPSPLPTSRTPFPASPSPTSSPPSPVPYQMTGVVTNGGNLRIEPRIVPETVLAQVCPGDRLAVLEQEMVADHLWLRVRVEATRRSCVPDRAAVGSEGWVSKTLVAINARE